jgi:hypothetical protein
VTANGRPGKAGQRLVARVRTPYGGRAPLKRPARRRVDWFAEYRHGVIERHQLTDPEALRDAYDLGLARRQQEDGQTPVPSVRALQKRLGLARRDYVTARETFETRWGDGKVLDTARAIAAATDHER